MSTEKISTLFNIAAPDAAVVSVGNGSNIAVDENYVFREWLVKLSLMWWSGVINRRLYLYGPTGSGKSTLVEQFAARVKAPLYRIGVHNRLEYNETLGSVQLVAQKAQQDDIDASEKGMSALFKKLINAVRETASGVTTRFEYAELGQALKNSENQKVILLIDEIDQADPSQAMAFNKLLDDVPVTLPTGEVIDPKNVWIAATGNTNFEDERGLYRGTQRQNIAFKSRFGMHEEVGYPESKVEEAIIGKIRGLTPAMVPTMVNFANEMRKLFVSGDLDVPLATRTLINWGKAAVAMSGMPGVSPLQKALDITYVNQCSSDDAAKIRGAWQRVSGQ